LGTALDPRSTLSQLGKQELCLIMSTHAGAVLSGTQGLRSITSLLSSCVLQATANRNQDAQYYANQQALLQKQLAELTLRAQKFGAESLEASEGLRKKRLKLHQDVEVGLDPNAYVL